MGQRSKTFPSSSQAAVSELKKSGSPVDYSKRDEWFLNEFLGIEVYSSIVYFVQKSELLSLASRPNRLRW